MHLAMKDKWLEAASLWEHAGKEPSPATVDERQLLVVSASRVKLRMRKFLKLLRPDSHVAATFYADGAGNLAPDPSRTGIRIGSTMPLDVTKECIIISTPCTPKIKKGIKKPCRIR